MNMPAFLALFVAVVYVICIVTSYINECPVFWICCRIICLLSVLGRVVSFLDCSRNKLLQD
jgi:hypothetical protein